METVSFKHAVQLFAAITPVTLVANALTDNDATAFGRLFNRALRRAWEWYWWPQLMMLENRFYRPTWVASVYPSGTEIWHSNSENYYRSTGPTLNTDVPGVAAVWLLITRADAFIAYQQPSEQKFTHVREIWTDNFRENVPVRRIKWEYDERGVRLLAHFGPKSAWMDYRQICPTFRGPAFDPAAIVPLGNVRYFEDASDDIYEGDFWECLATTAAGESPITAPAKWVKLPIPMFLVDFAVQAASLGFTRGETELSAILMQADGPLWEQLYEERRKLTFGQKPTAKVLNLY